MKKLIIFISLFFLLGGVNQSFSDTGTSNAVWTSNSGIRECGTSISHGVIHYGVPNSNNATAGTFGGTINCTTHAYYTSSNYTLLFTYNNGGITACPPGERVVGWNGINTITCQKFDDTPPSASDISSSITNGGYFRATNSQSISITGNSGGGSPITVLEGRFENITIPASLNSIKSSNSDNNPGTLNILETNENISIVDNDITANNYRPYSYNITKACDEAGNCTINPTSFNYNVYAGYINSGLSSVTGDSNFVGQYADGTIKLLTYTLRDDYSNKIIPVKQSNGITPVRNIEFILNYNNSLYLNQYNKLGSGVDISGVDNSSFITSSIGTSINKNVTITDVGNNDGIYTQGFRVYSPTYSSSATDGRQFVNGNFNINSIYTKLSDKVSNDNIQSTGINFQFRPLYITNITGSVKNNGFIVGTTQTGMLNVTPGPKNVYIEYGYYDSTFMEPHLSHPKLDLNYAKTSALLWNVSAEGYKNPYTSLSLFGSSSDNLYTKLVQSGSLSIPEQNTYFATHISTTIGGKNSVYSSDIIGMTRYAGSITGDNTSQRGVKITGLTHSKDQVDLVDGQSSGDIILLGNLEKSYFQRDIRKNSYSLIKEITPNNGTRVVSNVNQTTPGYRLGDVLYFGNLNGESVTINLSGQYNGVKTILVEGGNVYIKGDILANDKTKDILGIIAIKNDNGDGGNIYIHPNVLEINAILYADRAVSTADDISILNTTDLDRAISPDNGGTYEYLSKQLYIHGTIFSNNTIGGSVQSPYLCPFYITTCNLDISQKYDMNYLRRGYLTKRVATYEDYPVIINYNPIIQLTPPPLFKKQ